MAVAQQQSEIGEDKKEWRGGLSVIAIHGVRLGEEVGVRPGRLGEGRSDRLLSQPEKVSELLCQTAQKHLFHTQVGFFITFPKRI